MSIFLESILLPDLVIDGEYSRSKIDTKKSTTLGGQELIWEQPNNFNPITLVGGTDTAWITRSTLNQLRALADVSNANYILNYEGKIYNVRFRNEEKSVIYAEPILARPNHVDEDYYSNVILKFMEVT